MRQATRNIALTIILLTGVIASWAQTDGKSERDRRYQYFYLEAINQQEKGNFSAAFDLFRHARDINPDAAEVYFQLAHYYADLKNDTMMAYCFEKAAKLNPDNATYQERIGQYLIAQQQYDKAIESYERFYQSHHDRTDVLMLLLRLYGQENNYPKMLETLNRIETQEGTSEQTTLTKMGVYEQLGDNQKVYNELKKLVDSHPYDLNYRVMFANWLLNSGKRKAAVKELNAVLKEEPDNEGALLSMLDYYNGEEMSEKADELTQRLLQNPRTDSDTKLTLLRQAVRNANFASGDTAKVFSLFDIVLAQPQANADILMFKVAYLDYIGNHESEAERTLEKAIDVEPDNASARYELIQRVWQREDYDRVIALCQPAQQYNPEEMLFYYFQGLAHYNKKQSDEALETFRKGVSQINSNSNKEIVSDFYAIMGDILYSKGLSSEAYEAYDSCLQWKPDNIGCLNNYAYYLSEEDKDLSRAEQMSYKTIQAEPDNSTFLDTYAWILFHQQRYEDAKIYIDQALRNDSTLNEEELGHAGDIYFMTGDTNRALEYWQKALDKDPENALLQEKIKQKRIPETKK